MAAGSDRDGLVKQLIVRHGGGKEKIQAWDVMAAVSRQKNAGMPDGEIPVDHLRTEPTTFKNELRARPQLDLDCQLPLGHRARPTPQVAQR